MTLIIDFAQTCLLPYDQLGVSHNFSSVEIMYPYGPMFVTTMRLASVTFLSIKELFCFHHFISYYNENEEMKLEIVSSQRKPKLNRGDSGF